MPRESAGLLIYRIRDAGPQVLLVHPGGPFFRNKDDGAWSISKGEPEAGEDFLHTARREVEEEIGVAPDGEFIELTPVKQKGGKIVHAWAVESDCEPQPVRSNTFTIEWPPRSGHQQEFPEVDRAEFFDLETARRKINAAQVPLIDELEAILREANH
jgi:predicted NUDIX family NTP pyrophosphohydrolase